MHAKGWNVLALQRERERSLSFASSLRTDLQQKLLVQVAIVVRLVLLTPGQI